MSERFLNLNSVGGKFLAAILVLLIGIPGFGWVLERLGLHAAILEWIMQASLWAGAGLALVFIILVIVEQVLDARLFKLYRESLKARIALEDGYSECPCCGFRRIRDFETSCPVCGKKLL